LKIVTNGHASKRGHCAAHVDSNDTCRRVANPKEKWIVIRPMLVGMIRIVSRPDAPKLEENTAAYRVIRRPVVISRESTKLYRLRGQVSGGDVFASAKMTSM
jgi:hypothetical protein